jgi:peptide/nickel transport system substrate-binding protein
MRMDNPDLPWYDIRVRHALAMAIDNEELLNAYYGGEGALLSWPISAVLVEWADIHIPLNELPESIRELFEYHPDKARQLLAEAGYPDGFKTEIVCSSAYADLLSVIKEYWANIGVELELLVKDAAVYSSIRVRKTHKQMIVAPLSGALPFKFYVTGPGKVWNMSIVDDPVINEAYEAISVDYFDEPKRRQLMKEMIPYMLEQEYFFQFPGTYVYNFWQPWIKSYHGESYVGYTNFYSYCNYIWLDQDLKEEMTGTR